MSYPEYVVWFRGRPACPCLATWLPWLEKMLIAKGVIRESIDIAQLIGSASASANTHSTGGAFDIWQHDPVTIWVARQMGSVAWARTSAQGFDPHTHGVLRGCSHNSPAAYQISAGLDGYNGLGYGGRGATDDGPRPIPDRTWREGIAWAKKQLEQEWDEMASKDEIRAVVAEEIEKAFKSRLGNGRTFMSTVNLIAEKVGVKPKPDKG